jgi:flagellar biosynthesis/type III secretory pathway ATPase
MSLITSQSVTVWRAARRVDDSGTPQPQSDWVNAVSHVETNVSVQPVETSEDRQTGQILSEETWRLFSARGHDVDIQVGDRVEWRGRMLDVIGNPQRWHGLPSTTHHAEIILRASPPTRLGATGLTGVLNQGAGAAASQQHVYQP